jgi:Tfp pilus assembly protein PilX
MKFKKVKARFLREEDGFTLVEALVTMVMMVLVMFALYSIFDMSVRVFSLGGDKVEAVENARQGLDKMEREIRAAYPYPESETIPENTLFENWEANEITFGNELTGDGKILCPAASKSGLTPKCEVITYSVYRPSGGDTYALGKANSSGGIRQSLVEFVNRTSPSSTGLSFKYFTEDGSEIIPGGEESEIARVRIQLETKVPGDPPSTQVLTTEVDLRNRT